MNFMEFIKWLQDFRSQLEVWGVTTEGLLCIGGLAFLFFLLSAREVVGWFLKTGGLREEIRDLRAQITELQQSIESLREKPEETPVKKISAVKDEAENSSLKTFRLDH